MLAIGDFITVNDSATNSVLLTGSISKITENPTGYSVDGILFVNPNSIRITVNKTSSCVPEYHNELLTENRYKIYTHNNIDNTFDYDFFMWTEIEEGVKETVELLNNLKFVETYSSCCGHGKIPAYIDFHILDYNKFFDFLDYLNKNDIHSYCSKHQGDDENHYKIRFLIGVEGKGTCHLELVEIDQNFDKLNKVIKKFELQQC